MKRSLRVVQVSRLEIYNSFSVRNVCMKPSLRALVFRLQHGLLSLAKISYPGLCNGKKDLLPHY